MKLLAVTSPETAEAIRVAGSSLAGTRVSIVTAGGLAAVLAHEKKRPLLTVFSKRRALMRLVDQQRMLEDLIGFGPVLPGRPDARIDTESEAKLLIEHHAEALKEQLAAFGGCVQYQVTLEGCVDGVDARALVSEMLMRSVRDLMHMPVAGDGMVANVVVMIDREGEASLEDGLGRIDAALGGACRIRMIGPLPAVSFAAIDVSPFDEDALEAAASLLNVRLDMGADLIRRAYLAFVSLHHPDRVGESGTDDRVGAASQAYRLISRYQAARSRSGLDRAVALDVVRQGDVGRRAA